MPSGPYIITTKLETEVVRDLCPSPTGGAVHTSASRRAVATLEDDSHQDVLSNVARIMLRAGVVQQSSEWARVILRLKNGDLSPVGPLPDGTVIEVARVGWFDLAEQVRGERLVPASRTGQAEILDAYNANQEADRAR